MLTCSCTWTLVCAHACARTHTCTQCTRVHAQLSARACSRTHECVLKCSCTCIHMRAPAYWRARSCTRTGARAPQAVAMATRKSPSPPAGGALPRPAPRSRRSPRGPSPPGQQGALSGAELLWGHSVRRRRRKMAEEGSVCSFVFKKRGLAAGRGRRKRPSSDQEQGEGRGGCRGLPGVVCAVGGLLWCAGEAREGPVPPWVVPPRSGARPSVSELCG